MKCTLASALLSVGILMGCSSIQSTKRIPASVRTDLNQFNTNQMFPCGLKGSVDERIKDCSSQRTSEKEGFVLVTRSKDFKEVHKELSTGLLWSDRLPSHMDHNSAIKACRDLAWSPDFEGFDASISGVKWRLPSIYTYKEAEKNGIRKALPSMNTEFWTSTIVRRPYYSDYAWQFSGHGGDFVDYPVDYLFSVRCVAR